MFFTAVAVSIVHYVDNVLNFSDFVAPDPADRTLAFIRRHTMGQPIAAAAPAASTTAAAADDQSESSEWHQTTSQPSDRSPSSFHVASPCRWVPLGARVAGSKRHAAMRPPKHAGMASASVGKRTIRDRNV